MSDMKRRAFITLLGGAACGRSLVAIAGKVNRTVDRRPARRRRFSGLATIDATLRGPSASRTRSCRFGRHPARAVLYDGKRAL